MMGKKKESTVKFWINSRVKLGHVQLYLKRLNTSRNPTLYYEMVRNILKNFTLEFGIWKKK